MIVIVIQRRKINSENKSQKNAEKEERNHIDDYVRVFVVYS